MMKNYLYRWILVSLCFGGAAYGQVLPLNKALPVLFSTYDPTTSALTNADSTPSCSAYAAGSSTVVFSAAAVNMSTGKYRWSATLSAANGFAAGSAYRVQCDATVSGTTGSLDKGTVYVVAAELTAGVPRIDVLSVNNTNQTAGDIPARLPTALTANGEIKSDALHVGGQTASASGAIIFPGVIASPTNITAGTIGLAANSITATTVDATAVAKIQTGLYTIQQNVAGQRFPITFFDTTTGNPKPGVTGSSCVISKDYGGFSPSSSSPSEVGNGFYGLSATQTETNAKMIFLYCTGSGARAFQSFITTQH